MDTGISWHTTSVHFTQGKVLIARSPVQTIPANLMHVVTYFSVMKYRILSLLSPFLVGRKYRYCLLRVESPIGFSDRRIQWKEMCLYNTSWSSSWTCNLTSAPSMVLHCIHIARASKEPFENILSCYVTFKKRLVNDKKIPIWRKKLWFTENSTNTCTIFKRPSSVVKYW